MHAFETRPGIEHGVEEEVSTLVQTKAERRTGKEFHSIARAMLIRLGWRWRSTT